uniref:Uncharacterized protein n=1 Tax=viral metagenome TaxID=1070528 RepID=A0A6M3KNP0_9ZZZZ
MKKSKITALNVELDLYKRGLRKKIDIYEFWKTDTEAIDYLKSLFKSENNL